jgi:hypothetical protein
MDSLARARCLLSVACGFLEKARLLAACTALHRLILLSAGRLVTIVNNMVVTLDRLHIRCEDDISFLATAHKGLTPNLAAQSFGIVVQQIVVVNTEARWNSFAVGAVVAAEWWWRWWRSRGGRCCVPACLPACLACLP